MKQSPINAGYEGKVPHFPVLDGWRAISILLVLSAHMLPLGPKRLGLNGAFAATGMALFFVLSGFLITTTLLYHPVVSNFLIRRLCRVVPLAWAYILVALFATHAIAAAYPAHLFFYANLPPLWLTDITGHLWSLCVEMQFYIAVAIICLVGGRRGLLILPVVGLAVTANRILHREILGIVTWFRVDEILAGATLAQVIHLMKSDRLRRLLSGIDPYISLVMLVAASHVRMPWLNYARPYIAAGLIGCTLVRPRGAYSPILESRFLRYLATISYALYVLHPLTMRGWFVEGSTTMRYAKRPMCIGLTFLAAHLSTKYYEKPWIQLGKKWSRQFAPPARRAMSTTASL